ncbi:MAG: ATP-dependent RecD-like DNA helicase [Clostridia bacterium]|nr:ATP-dependent RecD-like DNA helicase [Clostridia bacterium]
MKEEKTGTLTDLIFYNRENFFAISIFESKNEQFYAVGYLPHAEKGRAYTLIGDWKNHPKYGEQFAFTSYEEKEPETEMGIVSFLSSGVIKGVGLSTARAIVKKFAEETMNILKDSPARLTEVPGIGKIKAKAISESYQEHREFANVVLSLQDYDITANTAMKIYRVYGSDSVEKIKENPYQLIEDVFGIGFQKADKIAMSMGMKSEDPHRIRSGIIYNLGLSANAGHTYENRKDFCEQTASLLDVMIQEVEDVLFSVIVEGDIFAEKVDGIEVVFLYRYYQAEQVVAGKLFQLAQSTLTHLSKDAQMLIRKTEDESGIQLSVQQKQAVLSSLENGVSVVTGGPGTGKTTIINTIMKILNSNDVKTALAAPTGRAAKRMSETTGYSASTIHRLLEYYYSEDDDHMNFGRTEENPLDFDCIIVDEMSMVDILLMEGLLNAVKPGSRLILVGDADQLPPIGAGNVLRDILSSETIHSIRLTDIFRQAAESLIVVNAHLINRGEYPSYNERDKDFFFLERRGDTSILETIKDLCMRRLPNFYEGCDTFSDIQVLTPTRKGIVGSVNLNKELQMILNPPSPGKTEKVLGERVIRQGDKVMQNKNDYRLSWRNIKDFSEGEGVFNGDIGIVESVDNDSGHLNVLFDAERLVTYDFTNLDALESAFAMTVHKSQGSEFPIVILPMTRFAPMLATRNLLYTAITRAKTSAILVGIPAACSAMVDNDTIAERRSGLAYRLSKRWEFSDASNQ